MHSTTGYPGQTLTLEVDIDQPSLTDQVVQISTLTADSWYYLPSTVTIRAGETSATFTAQVSVFGSGFLNAYATYNGTSLGATLPIASVGDGSAGK